MSAGTRIESLIAALEAHADNLPPVHTWSPDHEGEIDIRIDADGRWFHEDVAIERDALVRLFASVLRRDLEGYALVTPVELLRIRVDDVPFCIADVENRAEAGAEPVWVATTSLGEQVVLDADHPIRAGVLERGENGAAYAVVRAVPASGEPFRAIEGRLTRAAWYRLAEHLTVTKVGAVLRSGGVDHRFATP